MKGSAAFLFIKMAAMAFGYLNIIVIGKYFGTDALGLFSYIISVITIVGVLSGLGIEMTGLRFISKFKAKKEFGKIKSFYFQALKIISLPGLFFSAVLFFFPHFIAETIFGKPENAPFLRILALLLIPISIRKLNAQFLRAFNKTGQFAFVNLFFTPVTVIILIFIVLFSANRATSTPINIHFISLFLMFLISTVLVLRLKKWKTASVVQAVKPKDIFKVSFPMFTIVLAVAVTTQADKFILGYFVENSDIGIYHAMNRTALLINIVLLTANSSLAPKFSELAELNDIESLQKLINKSLKYITIFSAGIFLLIIGFSGFLIRFLELPPVTAGAVLFILAGGQMFSALCGPVGSFLLMSGNEKINRNVSLYSSALFIVLNILFIRFWGILGAAVATSGVTILKNLIFVYAVKKKYGFLFFYIPAVFRRTNNMKN